MFIHLLWIVLLGLDAPAPGCPFAEGADPCISDDCQDDPNSAACKELGLLWCEENPEDAGCLRLEEETCPFLPASPACSAAACREAPSSVGCRDVVIAWCAESPDDPGCHEDEGEPTGSCPFEPLSPPCTTTACADKDAAECRMVVAAWCAGHGDDPGCADGEAQVVADGFTKREYLFASGMILCLIWVAVLSLGKSDEA